MKITSIVSLLILISVAARYRVAARILRRAAADTVAVESRPRRA